MGEKEYMYGNSAGYPGDWCDMSVKCRCRWRCNSTGVFTKCHEKMHHRTCLISSTFFFFLCSFSLFGTLGLLFAWLTFSPFGHELSAYRGGCQADNEGSWAIGVYYGSNPFSLRPIELENVRSDEGAAWPVANPVLTCASVYDIDNPSNFVADPFLFLQGSKMYLFFETKNSVTLQGDIGVAQSTDHGATWQYLGIALDQEWHLSYPFVFEYDGQIYMMPEGSAKGDLRLYRSVNFPLQWALEAVIIRKPLVDASMVEHDGRYWIFGSDHTRFGAKKNGELEIWYANSPLGPWKPHRQNPVLNVDKSMGARSGGRPFMWEGRLYRVGQDCGETYGKRVRAFQIEVLTTRKFKEVEVPLGIGETPWIKGKYAWNGARYHHMDAQQLPSGQWIAVVDGDRVPSGHVTARWGLGVIALAVLIGVITFTGVIYGFIRCVIPSTCLLSPGKRTDARNDSSSWWPRPHVGTAVYKVAVRVNRGVALSFRDRMRWRSCLWVLLLFFTFLLGMISVCVIVQCFFGGNGAEEPYPVEGLFSQFTMVTMTSEARLWNLKMYVKHYSRCSSVREIVVVWNFGQPPDLSEFDSAVPVHLRVEPINSLNNRFKPDPTIKTRAVFELDDDIMMTCDDVERGFKAWRQNPERIVGFYPRLIDGRPLQYRNERFARSQNEYNSILTGAAFIDSEIAFSRYWSENYTQGRAIVDELFNCEDILLNFITANGTSSRSVEYVHPSWAVDTSKLSNAAISRDTTLHYSKRTLCLLRFSQIFGNLPLKKWRFRSRADGWDY